MNKKETYFNVLTFITSYTIMSFLLSFLVNGFSESFIGNTFLIIQIICVIFLPVVFVLLSKNWDLKFNKAVLNYGIILFLTLIILLVKIYFTSKELLFSVVLINIFINLIIPIIIFTISYKIVKRNNK